MRRSIVAFAFLAAACSSDRTIGPEDPAFDLIAGGCPSNFALTPGSSDADQNADGYHCSMSFQDGAGATHVVEVDNNIPAAQIGSCPSKFNARTALSGHPVDRNGNNVICEFFHPQNESLTQIDDNSRSGN